MKKSELREIIKEEIQNLVEGNENISKEISDRLAKLMGVELSRDYSKNVMKKKEEPKEEPKKEVKEEKSIYALALQYLNELKPELKALADKYKGKGNTSQLEKEINALVSTKTDNEEIQFQMKKGISGAFFRYYKG